MTYELSASVHKGTTAHLGHNRRTTPVPHASKDRKGLNVTYIDMELSDAYRILFDDALSIYNQKRPPSRRIDNYLHHIESQNSLCEHKLQEAKSRGASTKELARIKSRYPKKFFELIVSVGNCDAYDGAFRCGGTNEQIAVDVLNEYMMEFQARNPHLFVFSAHLHRDEIGNGTTTGGVPHLHIDYIPWTDEPGRGLPVRVSENGAFRQQGLTGDGFGTIAFQEQERHALTEIAKRHQITIIEGKHKTPKKHLSKQEYILRQEQEKAQADALFIEQEAQALLLEQDRFIDFVAGNSDSAVAYLEHLENEQLREIAKEYEVVKQNSDQLISVAWSDFNSATSAYFEKYREKKKALYEEIHRARQGARDSRKQLNSILRDIEYSNGLFINIIRLFFAFFLALETASMEREVKRLQEANAALKQQAKNVMQQSNNVSAVLRTKELDDIEEALLDYEVALENAKYYINGPLQNFEFPTVRGSER